MGFTRRDFLRASAAVAVALGLEVTGSRRLRDVLAREAEDGGVPVVWLQAQCCTGCSVSILNSIALATIDDLLVNSLDLEFHPTLMAAAGHLAVSAAEKAYRRGGYVLVVEGAIPHGAGGEYCHVWPGMTARKAVERYVQRASAIISVGTCASFGGVAAAHPNPTGAAGLQDNYGGKRVVKIPGCPVHPDWVVGTIAYLIANGEAPQLDSDGRPLLYYSTRIHQECPYLEATRVSTLGEEGCLMDIGCAGPSTKSDCPQRLWNAGAEGESGTSWCIGVGGPCIGCTEEGFPDEMSPFYFL